MIRCRRLFRLSITALLLGIFASPSWAGGAGWAFFAAALGLSVAASPYEWYAPYSYDPYYSDPYYRAYGYPYPYTSAPYETGYTAPAYAPTAAPAPVDQTPSVMPPDYLRPNMPHWTPSAGEPLPAHAVPRHDLVNFNRKLASVRALLDKGAAAGDIPPAQRDSEAEYLTQIERVAKAQASAQNGLLTSDQEDALLREIAHVDSLLHPKPRHFLTSK